MASILVVFQMGAGAGLLMMALCAPHGEAMAHTMASGGMEGMDCEAPAPQGETLALCCLGAGELLESADPVITLKRIAHLRPMERSDFVTVSAPRDLDSPDPPAGRRGEPIRPHLVFSVLVI